MMKKYKYICKTCNSSDHIFSYTPSEWDVPTQKWEVIFDDPLCNESGNGCGDGYGNVVRVEIEEDV
tara:strand:+ start:185 stop:382 length:198 start_codon:yes stop_codon:yes gene_type:complete